MAFSDSEEEKDRKRSQNRSLLAETNKRWSDQQKLEAVQSFLVLGNISLVARILSIPRITIQTWKASNWWKELVDELKVQERIELSTKMKKIVDAAHLVVEDRMLNGDVVMTQKGEMVRKPVPMKDAHRVAVDLLNQRDSLDKLNKHTGDQEHNTDKLEMLAERFAEFATKKLEQKLDTKRTVEMDVTDVELVQRGSNAEQVLFREQDRVPTVDESPQEEAPKVAD